MLINSSNMWIFLRSLAIGLVAWQIAIYPVNKSNLNWTAAFVIAPVVCVSILFWILSLKFVIGRDFKVDKSWREFLSFSAPFFPMMRYPLRFWLMAAVSMLLGGAANIFINASNPPGSSGFGGVFLLTGAGIVIAVVVAQKIFWYSTNRLQN